jgi:arylsulfatase A-like enzyme
MAAKEMSDSREKDAKVADGLDCALGKTRADANAVRAWLTPLAALELAVWFGLAAGLIELSILAFRVWKFEKGFFLRSKHVLWMVPLSDVLIYGSIGVLLAVALKVSRTPTARAVIVVFIFLACLSQLLLVRGLTLLTCVLISWGTALRTAGWFERRLRRSWRVIRVGTPAFLIVLIGLAAGSITWEARSRRPGRNVGSTASPQAQNVLLIVLDTVRADHLSVYGYGRDTTPNLKLLADQGVRFEHARATAPWTLPSHASMFTGRWPHELGVEQLGWLDTTFPTLAEFLGARGYLTAGFVANQFFCGHETGLSRGYIHYRDYPVTPSEVVRSSTLGWFLLRTVLRARDELNWSLAPASADVISVDFSRKDAATVNREFLDWLSSQGERPFFAFLNYFDAHDPYLAPASAALTREAAHRSRTELKMLRDWQKIDKASLSPAEIKLARDAYDDCITTLDHELGALISELKRRGVFEKTLLIVTADHGEQFGEHGKFGHGVSLHGPEVHVPLLIVAPAIAPRGRVVRTAVSLRDIPATVVELLGYEPESPFPGLSLTRTWQPAKGQDPGMVSPPLSELHAPIEDKVEPGAAQSDRGPIRAVVADDKVYIRHQDGDEELYEIDVDPNESRNIGHREDARAALDRCRLLLDGLFVDRARHAD